MKVEKSLIDFPVSYGGAQNFQSINNINSLSSLNYTGQLPAFINRKVKNLKPYTNHFKKFNNNATNNQKQRPQQINKKNKFSLPQTIGYYYQSNINNNTNYNIMDIKKQIQKHQKKHHNNKQQKKTNQIKNIKNTNKCIDNIFINRKQLNSNNNFRKNCIDSTQSNATNNKNSRFDMVQVNMNKVSQISVYEQFLQRTNSAFSNFFEQFKNSNMKFREKVKGDMKNLNNLNNFQKIQTNNNNAGKKYKYTIFSQVVKNQQQTIKNSNNSKNKLPQYRRSLEVGHTQNPLDRKCYVGENGQEFEQNNIFGRKINYQKHFISSGIKSVNQFSHNNNPGIFKDEQTGQKQMVLIVQGPLITGNNYNNKNTINPLDFSLLSKNIKDVQSECITYKEISEQMSSKTIANFGELQINQDVLGRFDQKHNSLSKKNQINGKQIELTSPIKFKKIQINNKYQGELQLQKNQSLINKCTKKNLSQPPTSVKNRNNEKQKKFNIIPTSSINITNPALTGTVAAVPLPGNITAYSYIIYEIGTGQGCQKINKLSMQYQGQYLSQFSSQSNNQQILRQTTKIYNNTKIIASSNCKSVVQIASLTKIMTFILVLQICERLSLNFREQKVKIGKFESNINGTSACIKQGQIYTIQQLFYGLMLPSGNDASLGLAVWGGKKLLVKEAKQKGKTVNNAGNIIGNINGFNSKKRQSDLSTGSNNSNIKLVSLQNQLGNSNNTNVNANNIDNASSFINNTTIKTNMLSADPCNNISSNIPQMKIVLKKRRCYQRFILQMNKKARQLNMSKTNYANSHGLSNKLNKSCAYDLAILCEYVMKNEEFKKVVNTKIYSALIDVEIVLKGAGENQQGQNYSQHQNEHKKISSNRSLNQVKHTKLSMSRQQQDDYNQHYQQDNDNVQHQNQDFDQESTQELSEREERIKFTKQSERIKLNDNNADNTQNQQNLSQNSTQNSIQNSLNTPNLKHYKKEIHWQNTHKLLLSKPQQYIGIKTGITNTAGACLASCIKTLDNRYFIIIVLGSKKVNYRFKETELLKKWLYKKERLVMEDKMFEKEDKSGDKQDNIESQSGMVNVENSDRADNRVIAGNC